MTFAWAPEHRSDWRQLDTIEGTPLPFAHTFVDWLVRTLIRTVLLALAPLAFVVMAPVGSPGAERASADAPHDGLSFAIGVNTDGDGDNDCGTGVPTVIGNGAPDNVSAQVSTMTCEIRENGVFKANLYLMSNGGLAAAGISAHVLYTGVTTDERGDSVWDGCTFEAVGTGPGYENTGCVIGLTPAQPMQFVGLVATFTFTCSADGSVAIGHGEGETAILNDVPQEHREAGADMLTIDCQEGLPGVAGDSDCNGTVNSIDAALILQNGAGLLANIPCATDADANGDGTVNSIDAALVLQVSAGLLDEL